MLHHINIMSKDNPKEKIISATKMLLGKKAMDQISVREIAAQAKVNIAAVNYYFGAKDALFAEALDSLIIDGQQEWIDQNLDLQKPNRSDLINYLEFLHLASIEQDGFAKTRILSMLKADNVNPANLKVYDTIYQLAKSLKPESNDYRLRISVTLAFSSLVSLSFSTKEIEQFTGIQLSEKKALRKYITVIAELLFPA